MKMWTQTSGCTPARTCSWHRTHLHFALIDHVEVVAHVALLDDRLADVPLHAEHRVEDLPARTPIALETRGAGNHLRYTCTLQYSCSIDYWAIDYPHATREQADQ